LLTAMGSMRAAAPLVLKANRMIDRLGRRSW
jgi:hypothetical protein